jgi:hypothetical protein
MMALQLFIILIDVLAASQAFPVPYRVDFIALQNMVSLESQNEMIR